MAETRGWSLTTYTKAACPHSSEPRLNADAVIQQSCIDWNRAMEAESRRVTPLDLVFVSHSVAGESYRSPQAAIEGFRAAWRTFTDRGAEVVVIRDNPRMTTGTTACLEANEQDPDVCARPIEEALVGPDLMVEAAQNQPNVHVVDLTDAFCWDGTCKAAIGGVVVYRDEHHLTQTFAVTLAPALEAELWTMGLV